MIRKHFGDGARQVELAVLDAIGTAEFPGRNRAIDQLIMMSSPPRDGVFRATNLPPRELWLNLTSALDVVASVARYGDGIIELS